MLVDHRRIIAALWTQRHAGFDAWVRTRKDEDYPVKRRAVKRSIVMLQSFKKHGTWPIGGA